MLLGNYGRDHQVGDSSSAAFDGSSPGHLPVNPISSPSSTSSLSDHRNKPLPPPPDHHLSHQHQMLAAACRPPHQQQQQQQQSQQQQIQQQQQQQEQRRLKPHSDQVLKCPRCDSMNTKFCYYNNYSLTQPRHFCKNCKRYWTKGGALRNVPVGGGCRKNKRVKQRQPDSSSAQQQQQQQPHTPSAPPDDPPLPPPGGPPPDGASTSSILLHHQFPSPAAHSQLYELPKGGNGVTSLGFEARMLSNPPISINWAGQAAFEGSILGLNLSGGIKQEPVHSAAGEILFQDPAFDHHHPQQHHHHHHHQPGMSAYVPLDAFSISGSGAGGGGGSEILWRFPQQPKLVSLLEDGTDDSSRHAAGGTPRGMLELDGEKIKEHGSIKHKMSSSTTSEYEQGDETSSPEWCHPTPDGFFDTAGGTGAETGYWGNGGWSATELSHTYGGPAAQAAAPGNHQLL